LDTSVLPTHWILFACDQKWSIDLFCIRYPVIHSRTGEFLTLDGFGPIVLRLILERLCIYSVPGLKTREGGIPSTRSRRISAVSPTDLPILKTARGADDHSLGVSDGESCTVGGCSQKRPEAAGGYVKIRPEFPGHVFGRGRWWKLNVVLLEKVECTKISGSLVSPQKFRGRGRATRASKNQQVQ
jgi:hypothetical protein